MLRIRIARPVALCGSLAPLLAGCATMFEPLSDHDCMTRVMYFESNQSSEDGMLAVGTVVMNRLQSGRYGNSVCGVVGQRGQFAPGVLDRRVSDRQAARASRVADRVLSGDRHPQVGSAMFFHTAGMTFPYNNMHYVLVAGGNAFYEKLRPSSFVQTIDPRGNSDSFVASYAPPVAPSPILDARRPAPQGEGRDGEAPQNINELLATPPLADGASDPAPQPAE